MRRLIAAFFVALLGFFAAAANAQTFTMTLSGTRETGGGDPAGRGLAVITIDGTNVYYFLWVQNIASPTDAHIHTGNQGVSGGVLVGLGPAWTNVATNTYMAAGSVPVAAGTTQPILQNPAGYYVNVHNGPFPNGAMRGQMLGDGPASYALATTLLGSREPDGGDLSSHGFTALVFDTSTLYYYLWEKGIASPTAAHVHTGGAGVNGGVLIGLSPTFSGGQAKGSVPVDAATLAGVLAHPDQFYVNIHSGTFPNGAIRGQLAATETDVNFTVVAHNAGLGTSFFRTDMRAMSLTDEPATVYAEWYLHGVTSATGPTSTTQFVIAANGEAVYDDVVSSLFNTSNRGAIRLLSAFPILGMAHNFNDQRPSGNGTFGEDNPGLGLDGALTSGALVLHSNRPKADALGYRTNVGYFNPSPYAIDVTFNVRTPAGALVAPPSKATLPAWSDDQGLFYQFIPGIPADQQTLENFYITFTSTKPIYLFSSLVDNKTDDSIHEAAIPVPAALTKPVGSAQSASPTGTITVPPGNTSVAAGTPMNFQGTGTDPNGESLTVTWDFGDGGSGTGYTTSHTYASMGNFTVTMTVRNTDGVNDPNPPTRTITVTQGQQSGPPTGTITTPAGNTSAYTGYVVSFAGTGTDPQGETLTGTWDFGDGSTATGFSASHTFGSAGVYTVTFTVRNTDGVSDPHPPTRTITVTDYNYGY
jgi:hypothetical protein